jgi:hypothetical protein
MRQMRHETGTVAVKLADLIHDVVSAVAFAVAVEDRAAPPLGTPPRTRVRARFLSLSASAQDEVTSALAVENAAFDAVNLVASAGF